TGSSHAVAFPGEPCLLALRAPVVTTHRAMGAYDAMTWNGESDAVARAGASDRTRRARIAKPRRNLAVRPCPTGWNFAQQRPHLLLKRRALNIEGHVQTNVAAADI